MCDLNLEGPRRRGRRLQLHRPSTSAWWDELWGGGSQGRHTIWRSFFGGGTEQSTGVQMVKKKNQQLSLFFSKENTQTGGSTQNYWITPKTLTQYIQHVQLIQAHYWFNRSRSWLLVVLSSGNKKVTPEKTSKDAILSILGFFSVLSVSSPCSHRKQEVFSSRRGCGLCGLPKERKRKVVLSAVTQQCSSNQSRQRKRQDVSDTKVKSCCYIKACKHFLVETSNKNKA